MLKYIFNKSDYCGRIITDPSSKELKKRVNSCIDALKKIDNIKAPVMPYLAAWYEDQKTIWYEYVSPQLTSLLNCKNSNAAETLRNNIITRRIYEYSGIDEKIKEEIVTGPQLSNVRPKLRKTSQNTGKIEAVYKLSLPVSNEFIWLKDEANIETFSTDNTCISLGSLTIVTKEMQAEEEREKLVQELQKALDNIKALSGLLPICSGCKKIRDDDGYWNQIDDYISQHADIDFSHGICPDCAAKFYYDLKNRC